MDPFSPTPGFRPLPPPGPTTPPASPKRTVPGSPYKRRRFFQYTEDNEGEMGIEQFIYRSDYLRSTTAPIPYPLPLAIGNAPTELFDTVGPGTKLNSEIRQILQSHHIFDSGFKIVVQSKPGYPREGTNEVAALHVWVDFPDNAQSHEWSPAKRAIKALLEDTGLDGVEIEIFDPQKAFMPSLFPIDPQDPHIAVYEAFREDLVKCVDKEFGRQWTSMCLYKVGNKAETTTYDIVIMVQPYTRHDWQLLSRTILRQFVNKHQLQGQNIGVQFMPGHAGFLPPAQEQRPGLSFNATLKEFPTMGSSIGVKGERGGGTLGGYMTLTIGNRTSRGFLTNSHVVEPAQNSETDTKENFYKYGVTSKTNADDPTRTRVHTMALKDIEATVEDIESSIDAFTKPEQLAYEEVQQGQKLGVIPRLEKEIEEREIFGKSHRGHDIQLESGRRTLAGLEDRLKICRSQPTTLGNVSWASGRALSASDSILDFAFVSITDSKLYDHCVSDNQLPPLTDFRGRLPKDYNDYGCQADTPYRAGPRVFDFGQIEKGEWYFKLGRTTGLTTGICHGTESHVNLGGERTQYNSAGKQGRYIEVGYTKELVIICSKTNSPSDHTQDAFAEEGDSGALIIDIAGNVVAILFGYVVGQYGPRKFQQQVYMPTSGETQKEREALIGTIYGAKCGLVLPMKDIQDHLRIIDNATLEVLFE